MSRYSQTVMDHFTDPRNRGRVESPDFVGISGRLGRGPSLVLTVKVADGVVSKAACESYGCGVTIAIGSLLTELLLGRSREQCRKLGVDALLEMAGGLPPDKRHCAGLAAGAVRDMLDQWERRENL